MKIISAKWRNSSGDSKLTRSIHLSLSIQHCYVQLIEWRIEFQSRKINSAVFHLQKFLALNQSQSSNLCHGSRQLKINILSTWFGRNKLFFLKYTISFLMCSFKGAEYSCWDTEYHLWDTKYLSNNFKPVTWLSPVEVGWFFKTEEQPSKQYLPNV